MKKFLFAILFLVSCAHQHVPSTIFKPNICYKQNEVLDYIDKVGNWKTTSAETRDTTHNIVPMVIELEYTEPNSEFSSVELIFWIQDANIEPRLEVAKFFGAKTVVFSRSDSCYYMSLLHNE